VHTIVINAAHQRDTRYWQRPDLGISAEDVRFYAHGMNVRIHSLGAVDSLACAIALKDAAGQELRRCGAAPIEAPRELWPRTGM
jgi:hypothetical protein